MSSVIFFSSGPRAAPRAAPGTPTSACTHSLTAALIACRTFYRYRLLCGASMDVTDPSLPPPPALCRAVFTVGRTDSRVTVRITAREASRLRSVAAVRAAREAAIRDLPLQLGGVAAAEIPPSSRPASAAVTPRVAPPPVPELATACDVRCEPLFPREESDAFCVRYSPCDTWLAAGCGDGGEPPE